MVAIDSSAGGRETREQFYSSQVPRDVSHLPSAPSGAFQTQSPYMAMLCQHVSFLVPLPRRRGSAALLFLLFNHLRNHLHDGLSLVDVSDSKVEESTASPRNLELRTVATRRHAMRIITWCI